MCVCVCVCVCVCRCGQSDTWPCARGESGGACNGSRREDTGRAGEQAGSGCERAHTGATPVFVVFLLLAPVHANRAQQRSVEKLLRGLGLGRLRAFEHARLRENVWATPSMHMHGALCLWGRMHVPCSPSRRAGCCTRRCSYVTAHSHQPRARPWRSCPQPRP